ncbi:hypothetical protein KFK09_028496 [Dendrobium nobile]|uniref:Uncharacterized protein n=1 Tax=Dendrobium nobile TaxID=94219 RepID=A0A8T3A392_DENNO|nr:hypothetical protein KFK09_028496 [Dendrobium nobile]
MLSILLASCKPHNLFYREISMPNLCKANPKSFVFCNQVTPPSNFKRPPIKALEKDLLCPSSIPQDCSSSPFSISPNRRALPPPSSSQISCELTPSLISP